MTIKDIAEKAGVSTATVSRVINGNCPVRPALRKRIETIIESNNYIPNAFARGISSGSMNTVGILCPTLADSVQTTYLSYIEENLRSSGFSSLVICNTGRESNKDPFLNTLLSKMVDAVIILGSSMTEYEDGTSFSVAASKIPVVVVNGYVKTPGVYSVYCDEHEAIREIVTLYAGKGYRRILYLCDTNTFSGYQKMHGYQDGLKQAGYEFDPALVLKFTSTSDFRRSAKPGAYSLLLNAIAKGLKFDAIVTADDILAAGAIEALYESGMLPGKDIPIVGFNNTQVADLVHPKLTSIDVLASELCSLAVMQLTGILEGKTFPKKVVTAYKIVERKSFRFSEQAD